jgi:hypothetical protein
MILKKAAYPRKTQKTRKTIMCFIVGELTSKALCLIDSFRAFCVFRGLIIRASGSARHCDL